MRVVLLLLILFLAKPLAAQDSVSIIGPNDFLEQVLMYHPLARQARLLDSLAAAELLQARGFFDPKIKANYYGKDFKNKDYYHLFKTQLTVPTQFGPRVVGGWERNVGQYVSAEDETPSSGLLFGGLELPLGRGLFTDNGRTGFRIAQIQVEAAAAERDKILNKLYLSVIKDYWSWYVSYNTYLTISETIDLAEFRFRSTVAQVEQGMMAAIDTTEALINLQTRYSERNQARVNAANARTNLSAHFWQAARLYDSLALNAVPLSQFEQLRRMPNLDLLLARARQNHPELRKLRAKAEQLQAEERLAREWLKPEVNLRYNALSERGSSSYVSDLPLLTENYKLGFDFEIPIFLRKERGKLQAVQRKEELNLNEIFQFERLVEADVINRYRTLELLEVNLALQEEILENYRRMVAAENLLFEQGESTIFYVNIRESKMLEAAIKLFEMRYKYAVAVAELRYAAGLGF
jgi:outer membrane protein TolC